MEKKERRREKKRELQLNLFLAMPKTEAGGCDEGECCVML